jgi:heme A synthase
LFGKASGDWRAKEKLVDYDASRVEPGVLGGERQVLVNQSRDIVEVKNRVQFGPILAGVLTAIATLLILTVLGLAIGSSALEPRDVGEKVGTGAAIWGIVSALIAFFIGGWVAAKTAAVAGTGSGMINGLMVGAAILAIVLWLTGSGVSGILGTIGSNIGDITSVVEEQQTNGQQGTQQDVEEQAQSVEPQQAFDTVKDGAWWTLLGVVLPLVASATGGLVGHNERRDVIQAGR